MKRNNILKAGWIFVLFALFSIHQTGCVKEECTQTIKFKAKIPLYMNHSDLAGSIYSEEPKDIKNPGKIYQYGHFLLINEYRKGIHVIDNTVPENPRNVSFIHCPGNVDMAIKNNYLYVDNYTDLVTLNFSDMLNVTEVSRLSKAIHYKYEYFDYLYKPDASKGIITGFVEDEVSETVPCSKGNTNTYSPDVLENTVNSQISGSNSFSGNAGNSGGRMSGISGVAGSMAKFALSKDYLYMVDQGKIKTYFVGSSQSPSYIGETLVAEGLETIFPYNEHLFIGSVQGMYIFNITSPENPHLVSNYQHVEQCDPVVVSGNTAYITLRSGNECGGWENVLEVVDISNLAMPKSIARYEMTNPRGLGVNNGKLFLCDGPDGMKIFDAANPENLTMKYHFKGFETFDVIPRDNAVLVIGADGFFQYSYNEAMELSFLSKIAVVK